MYERVKEYHDVIGRLGVYITIVRVMPVISRFNLLDIYYKVFGGPRHKQEMTFILESL